MTTLLYFLVFCIFYFVPAINAKSRHHKNTAAIVALNLLLGWTLIGWVVAMVWSLTDNKKVLT